MVLKVLNSSTTRATVSAVFFDDSVLVDELYRAVTVASQNTQSARAMFLLSNNNYYLMALSLFLLALISKVRSLFLFMVREKEGGRGRDRQIERQTKKT